MGKKKKKNKKSKKERERERESVCVCLYDTCQIHNLCQIHLVVVKRATRKLARLSMANVAAQAAERSKQARHHRNSSVHVELGDVLVVLG